MNDWKIKTGSKVTTICQEPVTSELRLETVEHSTLHFKCGALRFKIRLGEGDLLSLLRGATLYPVAQFEPLVMVQAKRFKLVRGMITLDAETLGMVKDDS